MKIYTCTCEQCKYVKNKRKNRKMKKKMKRLLNKKRRKGEEGQVFNFYWAQNDIGYNILYFIIMVEIQYVNEQGCTDTVFILENNPNLAINIFMVNYECSWVEKIIQL